MTIPGDTTIICEHAGWTITEEQHQDGDGFPRAWYVAIGPNGERVLPQLSSFCNFEPAQLARLIDMGFPSRSDLPNCNGIGPLCPDDIDALWACWMGRVAA